VRRYGEVLRVPYVAALIAATLVARFPIGINALAVILYLREQTGSFAIAGVVAGSLAAGSGVGAPVQGRLVDRFGQRKVLPPLALVHAAALGLLVLFTELGAPTAVLVACGVLAGFAIPPTSSVLRSMWPKLLEDRPHLLQPAYALDSEGKLTLMGDGVAAKTGDGSKPVDMTIDKTSKHLYVLNSGTRHIKAMDVAADGSLTAHADGNPETPPSAFGLTGF